MTYQVGLAIAACCMLACSDPSSGARETWMPPLNAPEAGVGGTEPWQDLFGTSASDQGLGIDRGPDGDLYLCGATGGALVEGAYRGGVDFFVQRRSEEGTVRWTRQFGSEGRDQAMAVSVAKDGTVFVGGMTTGALFGSEPELVEGYVLALSSEGEPAWARRLGPGSVNRVRAAKDGGVLVVGNFERSGDYDAFVAYLKPSGEVWRVPFTSPSFDAATDVRWDDAGVYVTGFVGAGLDGQLAAGDNDAFAARVSWSGKVSWVQQFGSAGPDVTTRLWIHGDDLVAVGYTAAAVAPGMHAGDNDVLVARFGKSGERRWLRQWGTKGSEAAYGIAETVNGQLALVGRIDDFAWEGLTQAGRGDAFILTLDAQGERVAVQQQGSDEVDEFQDVVATHDGGLVVVGYSKGHQGGLSGAGHNDVWIARL